MPIRLTIRGLSGKELLQIDVPRDVTVGGIKKKLADGLTIAPLCQQLVLDKDVLEDDSVCCFSRLSVAESSPSNQLVADLTLVVNVEAAFAQLKSREVWARMEGVRALACTGPYGDSGDSNCVNAILRAIGENGSDVRIAALEALKLAAPRGSVAAGDIHTYVLPRLDDYKPEVGVAAADSLCAVVEAGDETVIREILRLLANGDCRKVTKEYVRALGVLAPHGHESAIEAACLCAKNVDAQVRQEAVQAISKLAPCGHEGGTQLCVQLLGGDWQNEVKQAALAALDVLALEGDVKVTAALCECVETQFEDLRVPALQLLSRVAPSGHAEARAILQEYA